MQISCIPKEIECLLQFLDNSTVAALIVLFAGAIIGKIIYSIQKKIDRVHSAKERLAEALLVFEEHYKEVNLIIDRLVNTYNQVISEKDERRTELFKNKALPSEFQRITKILMEVLPKDVSKIQSIVSFYFYKDSKIRDSLEKVLAEAKEWHDFVQEYLIDKSGIRLDRTKKTSEIPELSLEGINLAIKKMIDCIR